MWFITQVLRIIYYARNFMFLNSTVAIHITKYGQIRFI